MKIRSSLLWLALIVILGMVNYSVFQKEQLRTTGAPLYLALAPVDPRSLLQGDYMVLDYAILQELEAHELDNRGELLISFDDQRIATSATVIDGNGVDRDVEVSDNQVVIRFQNSGWRLRIGADNYFFQEGEAEIFEDAEYAEVRIGPTGDLILVGLLDGELNPLGGE